MQYKNPQNQPLVRKALRLAGREDLIGYGQQCLVPLLFLPDPVFDLRSFLRFLHLHCHMLLDVWKVIR